MPQTRTEGAHSRAVLGIDAAWTATQPSGIALVIEQSDGWTLATAQPSYGSFLSVAQGNAPEPRPTGRLPDVPALLEACRRWHPPGVDLVAIDIPLSLQPITARRISDNLVSRAYGARHCATHTPSALRPGRLSDDLRTALAAAGYPLATVGQPRRAVLEVYPHPALVELASAAKRLPYKAGKVQTYWPELTTADRKTRLLAEWQRIVTLLDARISRVADAFPLPPATASVVQLKAFEDRLDAVVCAWIGTCALRGHAIPYGDTNSAIWIPHPRSMR